VSTPWIGTSGGAPACAEPITVSSSSAAAAAPNVFADFVSMLSPPVGPGFVQSADGGAGLTALVELDAPRFGSGPPTRARTL
jgi:hypothetical protein